MSIYPGELMPIGLVSHVRQWPADESLKHKCIWLHTQTHARMHARIHAHTHTHTPFFQASSFLLAPVEPGYPQTSRCHFGLDELKTLRRSQTASMALISWLSISLNVHFYWPNHKEAVFGKWSLHVWLNLLAEKKSTLNIFKLFQT